MKSLSVLLLAVSLAGCGGGAAYRNYSSMDYARDVPPQNSRCVTKYRWMDCLSGKTPAEVRGGSSD